MRKPARFARTIGTHFVHSVVVALFSVVTCSAQDVSRIDQVLTSYFASGKFMGSVLVARGENLIFSKGYGSANLEWNIPNSPSTKFRIASIGKQFTAAAILLLEERGKIRLDDSVKVYLSDAPASWDNVTVFRLLTHTSGIPDYTRLPNFKSLEPFPATPEQIVSWFRDKPLDFQPGERISYSNSGYILLGSLIEKVSGRSYGDFVAENIFKPLGMSDSGYDSNTIITNRAAG
jgi:CubicO group peptidase (beta-lactamase class C family)